MEFTAFEGDLLGVAGLLRLLMPALLTLGEAASAPPAASLSRAPGSLIRAFALSAAALEGLPEVPLAPPSPGNMWA